MGFLDKLKGAVNAVTGNAAKVTLEYSPQVLYPGDTVQVKITATSTGKEVKSKGAYLDLRGHEAIDLPKGTARSDEAFRHSRETMKNEIQVAPAFVLAPNETKVFEGTVQVPAGMLPTYNGMFAKHSCEVRGRIEALGNDPDSGWQPIRVGAKN